VFAGHFICGRKTEFIKESSSSHGEEDKMETKKNPNRLGAVSLLWVALFLSAAMVVTLATPASADDRQEAAQLVEKAEMTLQSFMSDSSMENFRNLAKQAKGILVVPQLLKGAFVFGASGGSGVLLIRDGNADRWFGPAFYTIGGASFGLQIGGQASEVALLLMTERGVAAMMSSSFKLGADVGVAAGPVGAGVAASTANLSADILTFSRSKGLYGGVSLDGAVVATRGGLNEAYYGKQVTPTDILVRREVTNPQAHGLLTRVTKMACTVSC
jgi:lipid-binding SYLF domain-containing protein